MMSSGGTAFQEGGQDTEMAPGVVRQHASQVLDAAGQRAPVIQTLRSR